MLSIFVLEITIPFSCFSDHFFVYSCSTGINPLPQRQITGLFQYTSYICYHKYVRGNTFVKKNKTPYESLYDSLSYGVSLKKTTLRVIYCVIAPYRRSRLR